MGDHGTVGGGAVIGTDASNHYTISSGTPTVVRDTLLNWELEIRRRAREVKAFVVVILVGVVVISNRLASSIVVQCCSCSIVNVTLGVLRSLNFISARRVNGREHDEPSQLEPEGSSEICARATVVKRRARAAVNFMVIVMLWNRQIIVRRGNWTSWFG